VATGTLHLFDLPGRQAGQGVPGPVTVASMVTVPPWRKGEGHAGGCLERRPGPRRALTEDEILDAALRLLDEGGANGASVRGIAAKVGVAPNAVYTYFPDKAIADLNQPGSPSTAERIAARHQALADAPAGQFPRVVAAAAAMASNISTEQYLWGLHRLLDGITTSQGIDPESATARRNAASNGPDVH
jgi:AcrR family transcriptional regulator